jgi:hypothetical protein
VADFIGNRHKKDSAGDYIDGLKAQRESSYPDEEQEKRRNAAESNDSPEGANRSMRRKDQAKST